ncbi:MAG: GNAT family protein [Solirubrobacteraceae bacterium]|nr:GNAT family protein [Patulibacter sp.]
MTSTKYIDLCPLARTDLPAILGIRNDHRIEGDYQPTAPRPITMRMLEAHDEAGLCALSSGGEDDIEFGIRDPNDPSGALLGIAGLYDVDPWAGIAEVGVTLGYEAARGRGLGIDAYVALAMYAFDGLGLRKLVGHVKGSNEAARGTCARLGLVEEGVLREHRWLRGAWEDLHCYAFFARQWTPDYVDWRDRELDLPTSGEIRIRRTTRTAS